MVAQLRNATPATPLSEEIEALPDEADQAPLVIERNGKRYKVTLDLDQDPFAYYDPEAARKALEAVRGILTREQGEALKAQIREDRGHGCSSSSSDE
jgi:hypothetical protein